MAKDRAHGGIEEFLRSLRAHGTHTQTDGQLLKQFLAKRDESAFAALVSQHGPMVLGVCRRILGNTEDAEDAFQATFLVLVRKAPSLASRAVLGDWLHGVARRTALNAKRAAARRRQKEQAMARPETQGEENRDDRLILLDEALSRLPEKYRLVIVLCELEARTRQEAAERLGWPEGTVAGRLARGRALLAKRLAQQGLTFAAGSVAGMLPAEAAPTCVPPLLASSTIKAAMLLAAGKTAAAGAIAAPVAALMEGVIKTMFLSKLKLARLVVLATVLLGAGGTAGVLAYLFEKDKPEIKQQSAAPKKAKQDPESPQRKKQTQPEAEKKPAAPAKDEQEEDRIRPGDLLWIQVTGTVKEKEIWGVYQVRRSGWLSLGLGCGIVNIKGLTLEEAQQRLSEHLNKIYAEVSVSVERPIPDYSDLERRVQHLEGRIRTPGSVVDETQKRASAPLKADEEDRIRPGDVLIIESSLTNNKGGPPSIPKVVRIERSGKIPLGIGFGRVDIKGLTFEEAEKRIAEHLGKFIKDPGKILITRPIPSYSALHRRVQQLEYEVHTLRSLVDELRKKTRD